MMRSADTSKKVRTTVFAPRLNALLRDYRGQDIFRLEQDTVGVTGPALIDQILGARPATELERPTFKPLHGRSISRVEASTAMQAIGRDVRSALKKTPARDVDLSGQWPHVGHVYLRDLILGGDPHRMLFLLNRVLELTPKLTWTVIATGAAFPRGLGRAAKGSSIARLTADASTYQDRRFAMGIYRRAAAPVCFTVSTLVANALWLGSPFDDSTSNRNILYEAMRLLPPSWNIMRMASPEYVALDSRITTGDDILILPLLSQRDPGIWDDPDEFRPERWDTLDPDNQPGYLPFGHESERCWGRHMVMPLAEMLLDMVRGSGLAVTSSQTRATVELAGLLGVSEVELARR